MSTRPDLSRVTAILFDHRNPRAAVKLLAAHADALALGDIKYLNHFQGYPQFLYWEIFESWKYVTTEFAMFLHLDGYVLNPQLWEPEFLKYDFIGAPWPRKWVTAGTVSHQVGNSGFCIKSRRLMNRAAALPWEPLPADVFLGCRHRVQLQAEGFTFAPVEVAARFSVEHAVEETPQATFGFHGPHGRPRFPAWDENRVFIR